MNFKMVSCQEEHFSKLAKMVVVVVVWVGGLYQGQISVKCELGFLQMSTRHCNNVSLCLHKFPARNYF